jgi:uncharacterized protein (TIGR02594 family)
MTKPNFGSPLGPKIKSDEIYLDTSAAPWMEIARRELGRGIKEYLANDRFVDFLRLELESQRLMAKVTTFNFRSKTLDVGSPDADTRHYTLGVGTLSDPTPGILGRLEEPALLKRNSEIVKYFDDLATDPIYDRKSRSFAIAATSVSDGHARVTSWCAAFVNWCLMKAGAPHLGYATARSWLNFGTPLEKPVEGCITIVKPSNSTGSTTGHVAFYVRDWKSKHNGGVVLLGGNQGHSLNETNFSQASVVGFRWPTAFDNYLAASQSNSMTA